MAKSKAANGNGEYKGTDLTKLRGMVKSMDFVKLEWLRFDEGKDVILRLLPYPNGDLIIPHSTHQKKGWPSTEGFTLLENDEPVTLADGRTVKVMLSCREDHWEEPCPMCELVTYLRSIDETDAAKVFAKKVKYLSAGYLPKEQKIVMVSLTQTLTNDLAGLTDKLGDIFHPETGRTLSVTRRGSRYQIVPLDPSPIDFDYVPALPDLRRSIRDISREDMLKIMVYNLGQDIDLEEVFGDEVKEFNLTKKKIGGKKR